MLVWCTQGSQKVVPGAEVELVGLGPQMVSIDVKNLEAPWEEFTKDSLAVVLSILVSLFCTVSTV